MKKLTRTLLPALIFVIGLGVLLYPAVSDLWNQHRQNSLISSYTETVAQMSKTDYSDYLEAARAYNAALKSDLHDAFSGQAPDENDVYWTLLNLDNNGVMGYIEIPKINVRLALYHGTGEDALQHGVGHLAGTSLPVGGENTHCVLSGHRGLPSALLFTDLDQMENGDRFYLHVLGDTLAYEVDQVLVVEPDDVSALTIAQGQDYVTLVTCTPYGVNTHRLLVRGHRVPLENPDGQTVSTARQVARSFGWQGKLALALAALAVVALILAAMRNKTKYKGKHAEH